MGFFKRAFKKISRTVRRTVKKIVRNPIVRAVAPFIPGVRTAMKISDGIKSVLNKPSVSSRRAVRRESVRSYSVAASPSVSVRNVQEKKTIAGLERKVNPRDFQDYFEYLEEV